MAWNQEEFERGVKNGKQCAENDGYREAIMQYEVMTNFGEYAAGWCKGVRRVMIDSGKWIECAEFLLDSDVTLPLRQTIKDGLANDRLRWVIDPEVQYVVGLFNGPKCLMVMYIEDGDFEESMELLDWADEFEVNLNG